MIQLRRARPNRNVRNLHRRDRTRPAEDRSGTGDTPRAPRTAVVISGGGHLGSIQVGMLRALVEHGVEPDVYVATSVGALNAAVMAACEPAEGVARLEHVWRSLRTEDVFGGSAVRHAWRIARRHDHLFSNAGLIRVINDAVPVTHFHHLRRPLRIVTAEIESGEERVYASGPLLRPLLASTALPGVFPPVRIGDVVHVDGGIVNNVPISHAADADRVYVLAVNDPDEQKVPQSTIGMVLRSFAIARANRFRLDLERYAADTDVVVIPQPEDVPVRFPDLSKGRALMRAGYEVAADFLDTMRTATAVAPQATVTPLRPRFAV